jgi:hypothetical protein
MPYVPQGVKGPDDEDEMRNGLNILINQIHYNKVS